MIVENIINDIFDEPTDVLCHQVNCMGKMGAGLALQIRNRYPQVYTKYCEMCNNYDTYERKALLGKAQLVNAGSFYVCNLFSQYSYGRDKTYTNLDAMSTAINGLMWKLSDNKQHLTISVPYGMGCGLAGGNWKNVEPLIVQAFANAETKYKMNITLKIVKRP